MSINKRNIELVLAVLEKLDAKEEPCLATIASELAGFGNYDYLRQPDGYRAVTNWLGFRDEHWEWVNPPMTVIMGTEARWQSPIDQTKTMIGNLKRLLEREDRSYVKYEL